MPKAFVVVNPVAGSAEDSAHGDIAAHFAAQGWESEIHGMSGDEDVSALVREAVARGCDLCVGSGGDGTVSAVADGLVGTDVPLGILPAGTGNVLARELGIPTEMDQALDLLTGEHDIAPLDMIRVGDTRYVLNVSIGIGSLSMRDTKTTAKQRFGVLAYALTILRTLIGYQPGLFTVTVDGRRRVIRAAEVIVANSAAIGNPDVRLSHDVHLDDGRLDVCVVRARTLLGYVRVAWDVLSRRQEDSRTVRCIPVQETVRIETRRTLPVEADGDIIGDTPVEATLERAAVRVVVPKDRRRY
ncbi:MAG TPA: diacylglycerol kinase family lipid kinase [Chloroflexi bacterium]|jgi:diacylglycerol kinase (ATP)|nr:diacylglycerol kinase family lipid kinase [Chloroflexota bacterium]